MPMKPLPDAVQSLLCATTRINTYRRAIEELVYNALDAKATSIAIRLDVPETTIQVVDNGYGVTKTDMNHIGRMHMTSKAVDVSSLKSVPNCYGFRGQSLASLIEVSKVVKITSRVDGMDETWLKTFSKGREKCIATSTTRPSKGTTVDVQGFLHNLTIQKKSVNPLTELQEIKQFLQHLSLVHNNVSISLRDNYNNDIVFQIHKCRDIYQSLSTLFMIEKDFIQELQVEKRLYKIIAYIGKGLSENNEYHWVYLNGRFIPMSKLYKILDKYFAKLLSLRNQTKNNTKVGNGFADNENAIFNKWKIPFYFVFITCPYNDYDINESTKTLEIEFKDWNNITKLLEKLVKFYIGDVSLKEVQQVQNNAERQDITGDTRDDVKKILDKILASNSKKLGVSQMQNGIKGKLVKRKKIKTKEIPLSKIFPNCCENARNIKASKQISPATNMKNHKIGKHNLNQNYDKNYTSKITVENGSSEKRKRTLPKIKQCTKLQKLPKHNNPKPKDCHKQITNKIAKKPLSANKKHKKRVEMLPKKKNKVNILVKSFQEKPRIVNQRCKLLSKKVEKLKQIKNIVKRKITYTESSQYSNIQFKNQNITVKKRVGEIIIHDSIPSPPNFNPHKLHNNMLSEMQKQQHKSFDQCIRPIPSIASESSKKNGFNQQKRNEHISNCSESPQQLTYESHPYYKRHFNGNDRSESRECQKQRHINQRFITKQSTDNFAARKTSLGQRLRFKPYKRRYANCYRKLTMLKNLNNYQEHSYTIEFTQSNETNSAMNYDDKINKTNNDLEENMYTINKEDQNMNIMTNLLLNGTYNIGRISLECQKITNTLMNSAASQQHEETYMDVNTIEDSLLHTQRSINIVEDSIVKYNSTYCFKNNATTRKADKQTSPMIPLNAEMIVPEKKGESRGLNVISVSKSREHAKNVTSFDGEINPLYMCDTILNSPELIEEEFDMNLNKCDFEAQSRVNQNLNFNELSIPSDAMATYNAVEEVSHHFNDFNQSVAPKLSTLQNISTKVPSKEIANEIKMLKKDGKVFHLNKETGMTLKNSLTNEVEGFQFSVRNRPRYVPKGMSPIFVNCNTKNACNFDLEEDYFEDSMYDDFAKAVDANAEIFEANVEDMTNLATRELNRVNERLKKDIASLCFQGDHLREAKVLGQVDSKFIAAKMSGISAQEQVKEYLILFDQHAVHERIRLEKNLSEYLTDNHWKSVALDDVAIKLKPDETLYLHNYRDKFERLGLRWTIEAGVVSVTAIPEAIIGKNARQVEIIMKAVKSLILEEIEAIKSQKGSLSLYPKSIMDLVFSEACRYAIKFGDRLAYNDCVELLRVLCKCKTPFQCAHGRPVMAVLMEIKPKYCFYKIDLDKLKKFGKVLNTV